MAKHDRNQTDNGDHHAAMSRRTCATTAARVR